MYDTILSPQKFPMLIRSRPSKACPFPPPSLPAPASGTPAHLTRTAAVEAEHPVLAFVVVGYGTRAAEHILAVVALQSELFSGDCDENAVQRQQNTSW